MRANMQFLLSILNAASRAGTRVRSDCLDILKTKSSGNPRDIIFTPEDRAAGAPEHEAEVAFAEGRSADERWHVRKDGSRFWGSGAMMAMHDANNQTIGLLKIFRDETAARETNEALARSEAELMRALKDNQIARNELEAASRAKDRFLAVLSHELRTPLTPVVMAVQTLVRRPDIPDPAREALEMIRRNVKIESHLIDDLLDLTRSHARPVRNCDRADGHPCGHSRRGRDLRVRYPWQGSNADDRARCGHACHQRRLHATAAGGLEPAEKCVEVHSQRRGNSPIHCQRG